MSSDAEFDSKIAETIRELEQALNEANAAVQRTEEFRQTHGIQRGAGARYIAKLPPAERAKAQKELDEFKAEVDNEVQQALAHSSAGSLGRMTIPRGGRIRV
jgi:hypothetical protein